MDAQEKAIAAALAANPAHAQHTQNPAMVSVSADGRKAVLMCSCGVSLTVGLPVADADPKPLRRVTVQDNGS